jgi:FixH
MKIITLSLIGFIVLMLGMGAYMMYATRETPESDYYAMDLAYQNTIEARKNVANLSQKPLIQYDSKNTVFQIIFPAEIKNPQGRIQVLNVADQSQDVRIKLSGQVVETFSLQNRHQGLHRIVLSWEYEGKSYYYEEKIML